MNELINFNFEGTEIRTVLINNEPYFVGKDVASVLGYSETNSMTKRLDDEDFISAKLEGMNMNSTIINESGLYSAVIGSRLPKAKKFKRWVTSEVLPNIRKNGMYATDELLDNPDLLIATAKRLKKEKELRLKLEEENKALKPKAFFADAVSESEGTILVRDLAKMLRQNGIIIGEKRLFEWLRSEGYLIKCGSDKNRPTQKSMEMGLFKIKETAVTRSTGTQTAITPKVTGKGQLYFINKFLEKSLVTN
ncbi:phage antirepressor [Listeria kieliensis]